MTDGKRVRGQVHRFRDAVGAYLGTGETVYLRPEEARKFARALYAAARDVERVPFGPESTCGTVEIDGPDGLEYARERRRRKRAARLASMGAAVGVGSL